MTKLITICLALILSQTPVSRLERQRRIQELSAGDTLAWARHKTGVDQDDEFESVAVIPGANSEEVWVVVNRTIDGTDYKFVEQFQPVDFGDQNDAWFVDSGIGDVNSYGGPSSQVSATDYTEYFIGVQTQAVTTKYVANGKTDGTLDTTWGSSGYWNGPTAGGRCRDAIQLTDNRILVAHTFFKVTMIATDGTTDTSWATSGTYTMPSNLEIYKILQDNNDNFHLFAGSGSGFSYVKIDSDGAYVTGLDANRLNIFYDAIWSDSNKTRMIAIGGPTVISGKVPNMMAIKPDGTVDTTWTGNLSLAGYANLGGAGAVLYHCKLLSDGGFVIMRNDDSNTLTKFLSDGSGIDTSWGSSGIVALGALPVNANSRRMGQIGDQLYVLVDDFVGVNFAKLAKIDSDGTVLDTHTIEAAQGIYHCLELINDKLFLGTTSASPALFNIERWSTSFSYEVGFDLTTTQYITFILPDESTQDITYYGVDVNHVEVAHLAETEVCVYADGRPIGNYTVFADANGVNVIDLEDTYDNVIAGINYYSIYESFPLSGFTDFGPFKTKKAQITNLRMDFYETLGCNLGVSQANSSDIQFSKDSFATRVDMFSGPKVVTFPRGITREPILYLWEWDPVPWTTRGLYVDMNITYEGQ